MNQKLLPRWESKRVHKWVVVQGPIHLLMFHYAPKFSCLSHFKPILSMIISPNWIYPSSLCLIAIQVILLQLQHIIRAELDCSLQTLSCYNVYFKLQYTLCFTSPCLHNQPHFGYHILLFVITLQFQFVHSYLHDSIMPL